MDDHVAVLPDAVGTVGRLRLDGRVPPEVEVDDVARRGEVESGAARLEADDEHLLLRILLELLHHLPPFIERAGAVEEERLVAALLLEDVLQDEAHLLELGEHQGLLARLDDPVEERLEVLHLAGSEALELVAVVEVLRRMVADLLEVQDHLQHDAASLEERLVVGRGDAADGLHVLLDGLLVERRLLRGEGRVLVLLDLVRKIGDDRPVGLEPPDEERRGDALELLDLGLGAVLLYGLPELVVERLPCAEVAGVHEVHD